MDVIFLGILEWLIGGSLVIFVSLGSSSGVVLGMNGKKPSTIVTQGTIRPKDSGAEGKATVFQC